MDPAHVQEVFETQRRHRWHIAQSTAGQRIAKLKRLRAALLARRHEIVVAMQKDFGKCQAEVAISEIAPVTDEIAFVCALEALDATQARGNSPLHAGITQRGAL